MNWTLIKKDLRLMRPVTIGAIILAVIFYITLPSMAVYDVFKYAHSAEVEAWSPGQKLWRARFNITAAISTACVVVNSCSLLWAAAIGGMSFAYERRERWADLLGALPVTREQWIATKFASSMIWVGRYLAINAGVYALNAFVRLWMTDYWNDYRVGTVGRRWDGVPLNDFVESTLTIGSYALALFGMAWLVSTILRSAVISACIPIGTVVFTFIMVVVVFDGSPIRNVPTELGEVVMQFVLPLAVAAVTIPAGIAIQRIRATP